MKFNFFFEYLSVFSIINLKNNIGTTTVVIFSFDNNEKTQVSIFLNTFNSFAYEIDMKNKHSKMFSAI